MGFGITRFRDVAVGRGPSARPPPESAHAASRALFEVWRLRNGRSWDFKGLGSWGLEFGVLGLRVLGFRGLGV